MIFMLRYIVLICFCLNICNCSIAGNLEDLYKKSLEELLDLTISTAGKKEEKISEIPASVVIISSEDIKRYGYTSISEILKNVPGLYAISDISGYGTTFGIRGFWSANPKNIIFLVNGVKQNDAIFNAYMTQYFDIPVETIDKIEVVRGPMSVIYGEGAFFGAINIITDEKKEETLVSSSYGAQNTIRAALKSSGTEGSINYSLSAGYFNTDGPDEPLDKMTNNSSGLLDIHSGNNTTEDRLEMESKHINISLNKGAFYSRISFNENIEEIYVGLPAISDGTSYIRRNTRFKFGFKKKVNPFFSYDINMAYYNFNMQVTFDWNSIGYNYSRGRSNTYETESMAYFNFSEKLDVTTGICFRKTNDINFWGELNKSGTFSSDKLDDNIILSSIFTQANYTLTKKIKLIAGIRFERQSKFSFLHIDNIDTVNKRIYQKNYTDFIPRFAAVYAFSPKNIFKVLYGKANSRPSFFQIRDQILGRQNKLQNEYIQTFELNYTSIPLNHLSLSTSIFYNTLDKLIVRKLAIENGEYIGYGNNSGKIITKGIEFTAQTILPDGFQAELSMMYQDSKDQRNFIKDMVAAYSPKLLGYFKTSYCFDNGLSLAVSGNYVDKMETLWDETKENADGSYGGRIGKKTDEYFTMDANIRMDDFIQKGLFISIHGSNIFDKQYLHPKSTAKFFEKGSIGQGRLLMISMGMKF
ncbi:TonB-dependent receptor, plug domain protein [Candidatus Magnetomorum sp. HK-1]|nr:TonB-dependent receptor, plug domain protein [Candidatus Magnetomorum sp. HK-1]